VARADRDGARQCERRGVLLPPAAARRDGLRRRRANGAGDRSVRRWDRAVVADCHPYGRLGSESMHWLLSRREPSAWLVSVIMSSHGRARSTSRGCRACKQARCRSGRVWTRVSGAPSCLICLTARQRETERHPKSRQDEHWLGFAWFLTATNAGMSCLAVSHSVSHETSRERLLWSEHAPPLG
jgi:hypothetical protein